MPRILVTGHNGYVGSRLIKRLEDTYTVEGSLLNAVLPDVEVVYHLAAYASVFESWNRPVDYMENLRTTVRLVHAYPNAKIIHASTCAAENPEASPYAFSKKVSADYLKMYHKNWVNLIFPNIFGDSPRSVVDIFRKKQEPQIWGDGLQVRDYVHVDDIVEALVRAKNWNSGEYSLGSGVGITVKEIAEATGKPITYAPGVKEQREAVIPNTTPDGWKPTINVLEYVKT